MRTTAVDGLIIDVGDTLYFRYPYEMALAHRLQARLRAHGIRPPLTDIIGSTEAPDLLARHCDPPDAWHREASDAWASVETDWARLSVPVPGALRALATLRLKRKVILANQPPTMMHALIDDGCAVVVDEILLDSFVGSAKPDPAAFGLALAALGTSPQRTVMVGDRWDHDIEPALAMGMQAVWVCPPQEMPVVPWSIPRSWADEFRALRPRTRSVDVLPAYLDRPGVVVVESVTALASVVACR